MKQSSKIAAAVAAGAAALFLTKKKGIAGIGAVDTDAVREILLWYKNTRELQEKYGDPMVANLVKKMQKGIELSEEHLANSSVVDNIVRQTYRDYARSFGGFYISPETRKAMKREIAHQLLLDADDEYSWTLNNK